jgi:hypothetical protein
MSTVSLDPPDWTRAEDGRPRGAPFKLVVGEGGSPDALTLAARVDAAARVFVRPSEGDPWREDREAAAERAWRKLREAVERALADADQPRALRHAIEESLRIEDFHAEWTTRILLRPISVGVEERDGLATDVVLNIKDVSQPISEERQRLKTEIDGALSVVKLLHEERAAASEGIGSFWFGRRPSSGKGIDPGLRLDRDIRRIADIARIGLAHESPSQVALARADLAAFKAEFAAREAGAVKNAYVGRLFLWCFLGGLACFALLLAAPWLDTTLGTPATADAKPFLLLFVGAAIGTWLSFSLRRVTLGFADLVLLEEDRLNPGWRVLFVFGLTFVVGLLLTTGLVSLGGGAGSAVLDIAGSWRAALLVGLVCGIGERAIATAVRERAEGAARTVGGTRAAG